MEINDLEPVRPAEPPAKWLGGKSRLAPQICEYIDEIPHKAYAEPFVGMGGVFFRRRRRPRAEFINDVNRDLVTLFRILQYHYVPFVETLRWCLGSRAEFDRLMQIAPSSMTDLQRAARFLYLQRLAFSGKISGQSYAVDVADSGRFDITRIEPMLGELHDRLAGVTIECLPYGRFIERYDGKEMLFYLDPPYWGCENDYGAGIFNGSDFRRLAEQLAGISARFMMSINDVPQIRSIFGAFHLESVTTKYTAAGGQAIDAAELLISNVELSRNTLL